MAMKEKNTKKRKTLLWVGLGIIAAGVLAFGGAFALGAMVLARDLLYLSIFVDTLMVGGVLGKTAVDAIADKMSSKNKTKQLARERIEEQKRKQNEERTNESVFELGQKPTVEDISRIVGNMDSKEIDMNVPGQIVMEFDDNAPKNDKKKNQTNKR